MKKFILAASLILVATGSVHAEEKTISCSSAVYGIMHQSCNLTLELQDFITSAQKCSTDYQDNYYFSKDGQTYTYDLTTCSFK